jgi:dihydrofolate reductase
MGKIVVSENVTVDGVVQDPTGEEGFKHGGWFAQVGGKDREGFAEAALDEARRAEAFLMGRRTFEFLVSRWPSRTGELAARLNSIPKYVVSSTLDHPDWSNTTVMKGHAGDEVSKLKRQTSGEIVVPGSRQLVHELLDRDLVDEVRLLVYPFVLGTGSRLFGDTHDKLDLRLVETMTVGDGLLSATYEVIRAA